MGASDYTITYPDVSKDKLTRLISRDTEVMAAEDGYSYSGTWASKEEGVNFLDKTFASEDEAREYILDHNSKWEMVDAARFESEVPPVELGRLAKEIDLLNREIDGFDGDIMARMRRQRSKKKTCKSCGSTITIGYLSRPSCPACTHSFLTKSDEKRKASLLKRLSRAEKDHEALLAKTKSISGWVVGGMCPC